MEIRENTKKKPVGLITAVVTLSVIVACLCVGFLATHMHNNRNKAAIERTYEQNVFDLGDNLENIEVNLSKLMVSGNGSVTAMLLTDVYSEALAAERALSTLPVDYHEAENAAAFLNKVADFSISYQRALMQKRAVTDFRETAETLYVTARAFNAQVKDYTNAIARHELDIRKITAARPFSYRVRGNVIAHNSVEYPELIYDGPFSDARKTEVFALVANEPKVTLKEAEDIALAALPDLGATRVKSVGKSEGEPLFELALFGDRANAYVQVSERGGKVVSLNVSRELGRVLLGEESAKALAEAFARKLGYDVQPVWYLSAGGIAYVNLAPIEDDTVLYTDLVKVKVALDNGDILGLEAKGYCLNHTERSLVITLNRAAVTSLIDDRLVVSSVRGALIPLENNETRLCLEVAATYKGLDYFIYLDGKTGETVKVMRTVDSDQGSMVL